MVPSAKARLRVMASDGNEAVFLGRHPFLCDGRAKYVTKQGLASGGVERAGAGCGVRREPIERSAKRLVVRKLSRLDGAKST